MIGFACPGCSATFTVDDAKAGKQSKCPKCQAEFVIPAAEPTAEAPPPLPKSKAPAVDPNEPVEIDPCPKCGTRVTVMPSDLGSDVECPSCANVFTATKPGRKAPAPPPAPPKKTALESTDGDGRPRKSSRPRDDDDDDRPSKRRPRDDDDDEDDRPSSRRRRDDDDDDEDDRPRRKKAGRRRRGGGEPHRGTLILVLGILSFVACGIFTAIPAWIMGKGDLRKMDNGSMDDEGRSTTQIGMYLGMASTILTVVVGLLYCVIIVIAVGAGAGKGR